MDPALKRQVEAYWNETFGEVEARAVARGEDPSEVRRKLFRFAIDYWNSSVREEREVMRGLLLRLITARGWSATAEQQARIASTDDVEVLMRWCERLIPCQTLEEALDG